MTRLLMATAPNEIVVADLGLSSLELDILTVLVLANEPISRSAWTSRLRAAGLRAQTGHVISTTHMLPIIERFERLALLRTTSPTPSSEFYEVETALSIACVRDAHSRGALDRLLAREHKLDATVDRFARLRLTAVVLGTVLRVALTRSNQSSVAVAIDAMRARRQHNKGERHHYHNWLLHTLGTEPPRQWLETLGVHAEDYLAARLDAASDLLVPISAELFNAALAYKSLQWPALRQLAMLNPDEQPPARLLISKAGQQRWQLVSRFWQGDHAAVVKVGAEIIAGMTKSRRYKQLSGEEGLFLALSRAFVRNEEPCAWEALSGSIDDARSAKVGFPFAYQALGIFRRFCVLPALVDANQLRIACGGDRDDWAYAPWPVVWVAGLVYVWCGLSGEKPDWLLERLTELAAHAGRFGRRLEGELTAVLYALHGGAPETGTLAAAGRARAPWELTLDTLLAIAEDREDNKQPLQRHLVWQLLLGQDNVEVRPREVAAGVPEPGRQVAIERLLKSTAAHISEADRRVLARATEVADHRGRHLEYRLGPEALLELVDHPHVVRGSGKPVSVTRGEPTVTATTIADGAPPARMELALRPRRLMRYPVSWEEQSHDHLVVYERTPLIQRIVEALGNQGVIVPQHAGERLGKVLGALGARVRVNASADIQIAAMQCPSDSRVVALLHWNGTALRCQLRVAPLGLDGPRLAPGEGARTVMSALEGQAVKAERDLAAEVAALDELLKRCPAFAAMSGDRLDKHTDDLQLALELVLDFNKMGDALVKAWPRGVQLSVPARREVKDLRIRVNERGDWLEVIADLPVDEGQVLAFKDILAMRQGRYIKLGPSRFLALGDELVQRLEGLEQLGQGSGAGVRVRPIAIQWLEELSTGADDVLFNGAAKSRLVKLKQALALTPRLPRGFGATLREYQWHGYCWMARLAAAGLGAVLADDMGLGKTVQALALLLSRAKHGPALVVAPTSVASNWLEEANRFAPRLRARGFNDGDRVQLIEGLRARDLLICSYGVLVTERERLANASFDTVVFDEAHMLKNASTKRAKAAAALSANFRLALTGTPVENHLGELWSLMNITVPGLLGSEKSFEQRFVTPAGGSHQPDSRHLRDILRPFLLRRTKTEILSELPERTEVTLRVRPTVAERAFYEALRRRASEQLSGSSTAGKAAGRLQILAEITRLRQAAVDPRLVDPVAGPPGAKLDALVEQLTSVIEAGHRALVFSQFLGSLRAISERLLAAGIRHLTLDGSTPAKVRSERIAAFQGGGYDAFVMSLKAGGVGINLTEADYVVHVDPWWNPAVEEQASARAHRLGQKRMVTVYRFITEGTIEEKILALHQRKRALAEDLLEDMGCAKKLDLDELRALLQ